MSKIAIITDLHFGVRNDSKIFIESQKKFYKNVFFKTIDDLGIKTIINMGDTFDRRKYVNYLTLDAAKKMFLDEIQRRKIDYHVIAGNHDCFYKNTNAVNSLDLTHDEYPEFNLYIHTPYELKFGSTTILLSPWISPNNRDLSMTALRDSKAQKVMGHFEITGFEMMRGQLCEEGLDKNVFRRFSSVYSGHFHHPSSHSNISYLGAPYEMTWTDYDGKRGFHVLDTSTDVLTFVSNPYKIFHKVFYDDSDMSISDITTLDFSNLTDTMVKVIIKNKNNPYIFDLFIDKLQNANPADIKIVEDHMNLDMLNEEELIDEAQDTHTIMSQYIDSLDTRVNKPAIKKVITEIYQEAVNL